MVTKAIAKLENKCLLTSDVMALECGMEWHKLMPIVTSNAVQHDPLDVLVVQLGKNDLVLRNGIDLTWNIKERFDRLVALI